MNNYSDDNTSKKMRGNENNHSGGNGNPKNSSGTGSVPGGSRGKKTPVPLLIVADVLAAALLFLVFYMTDYELNVPTRSVTISSSAILESALSEYVKEHAAANITDTTPDPNIDPSDWRAKFADKFTDGTVVKTENSYKSANINITVDKVVENDAPYFIADIYIADLKYFRTAFAKDADVMGGRDLTSTVAKENNAILAINGDHCLDNLGTVVRNGQMYREKKSSGDVLVMNYDGSMQTYSPSEFDVEKIKEDGVYQVWTFGPMLLKDGKTMASFNSIHPWLNPRTAIGYYEPGHYCFVQVGGRESDRSIGCLIKKLSVLFEGLGCKAAYNLDGGKSSEIIFMGEMLNSQYDRRSTPDIVYIGE